MRVADDVLQKLLSPVHQFLIPLFQRSYVWEQKQWQALWEDLMDLIGPDGPPDHFMGSLVCVALPPVLGRNPQFLFIDGQQRLLTFTILFCAMRDVAGDAGIDSLSQRITGTYLTNQYENGLDLYKVLPRLRERAAIFGLIDGRPIDGDRSLVTPAYNFFRRKLRESIRDRGKESIQRLYDALVLKITFVMITLDSEKDNPFEIFQSLNSTGQQLEESDLIRNQVFMRVPLDEQDEFDAIYWRPFEEYLSGEGASPKVKMTDFYRDFLMKDGGSVKKKSTHVSFKALIDKRTESLSEFVIDLKEHAEFYRWFYRPDASPNSRIMKELKRLSRIGITTPYPMLMTLFSLWKHQNLSETDLIICLNMVQSYLIRRQVVGESKQSYWFHFSEAIAAIKADPSQAVAGLAKSLQKTGWPSDDIFIDRLKTYRIYQYTPDLARLVLQAIEETRGHKEMVNVEDLLADGQLSIEHIMPQKMNDDEDGQEWKEVLGADYERIEQMYSHTLGNLTLTGYNRELSNKAFATKRAMYAESNLELNREIAQFEVWDETAIVARCEALAKVIVHLWPAKHT